MLGALAMYGPDHQAHRTSEGIAFGRCLKKLVPEDVFDCRPLHSRGHLLIADLRLDNRDELISALSLSVDQARQAADSAILLAALEHWGDDAPDRLVGDYAFAYWDGKQQRLLLARDPFGQRPLHFHCGPHLFAFASMPKGLHALPGVPRAPDLSSFSRRVALVPLEGRRSFYEGIERVEPGHLIVVTREGIDRRRHWQPRRQVLKLKRPEDYAEAFRDVLDQATASRLWGVGDAATQLSGGLDSTSVTASAARLQAARGKRVVAFTAAPRVGYDGAEMRRRYGDESGHAAEVATRYDNLDHIVLRPSGAGLLDDLDANVRLYDSPPLNLCNAAWLHDINAAARARGLGVLLVGDRG